jgi:hypothetical protein
VSDPVRAIADAVLYEGYVLWPYRRSALKNTQRWTFGGVFPRAHAEARAAGDDPCTMRTQCLVEGDGWARIGVTVRFLHVLRRQVLDAAGRPVDALDVAGETHLTWDEAAEREFVCEPCALHDLAAGIRVPIRISAGRAREPLHDPAQPDPAGALERSWEALEGSVRIRVEPFAPGVHRLTAEIANETPLAGGVAREQAQRHAFCSTHTIARVEGGAFVSMTDPPRGLAPLVAACENRGTWPVLVGDECRRDTLLSSPIILEDFPKVAPQSPGDLFDGGEIDQLLILNVLSLTDAEKREARASDPRVRELMDRTEALTPEQLMRLHGQVRRS